ncbi:MAG: AmpE [Gammaproteobacteria bacterium]|nr:MAG: AmpE [Gammaproteobacteria bacterium]TND03630.1 MAG: AmpE [Gammaproteobacteria bacterium]
MTLIAILLSLAISRMIEAAHGWRRLDWLANYADWARSRMAGESVWNGPLGVFVIVAPVVFVTGWLHATLSDWLGMFGFAFAVVVLVASIGPRDVDKQVEHLLDAWGRNDADAVNDQLAGLAGDSHAPGLPREPAVIHNILAGTHTQLLGIIFWFVVLGPIGAVAYRFSVMVAQAARHYSDDWRSFTNAAEVLHGVLDWIPSRLTALGYGITGSFVDALHSWRNVAEAGNGDWVANNRTIVIASGTGALQLEAALAGITDDEPPREFWFGQISAAQALSRRTIVLWLAMIAILTLAGWTR